MSAVLEPNQATLMGREHYSARARNREVITAYVSISPSKAQWDRCFESISAIRKYTFDWNDEGADPPKTEVISLALKLAKTLRSMSEPAPTRCFATDEGSIIIAWDDESAYFEVEIDEYLRCVARQLLPGAKHATSALLDPFSLGF